jgi:hypothetical protein
MTGNPRESSAAEPLLDTLIHDLVDWWHAYPPQEGEVSRKWSVTGEKLSMGLDEAAAAFVEHAVHRITEYVRAEHDAAWRRLYATLPIYDQPTEPPPLDMKDVREHYYHTSDPQPHAREAVTLVHIPTGVSAVASVNRQQERCEEIGYLGLRERALAKLTASITEHIRAGNRVAALDPNLAEVHEHHRPTKGD